MKKILLLSFFLTYLTIISLGSTVLVSADTATEKWGLFELAVLDNGVYNNPFWDATITGQFSGPNGEHFSAEGFYFDSNLWKIRFSPTAVGVWNYTITFSGSSGITAFIDSFICFSPSIYNHGFIHVNPNAMHSFIQDDSTLFIPIGTNGNCPVVTAAMLGITPNPAEVESMWDSLAKYHINTYRFFMFNQPEFEDSILWCPTEGAANLFYNTSALDQYNIRCGKLIDRWFKQANEHGIAMYLDMTSFSAFPFNSSPWSLTKGGFYTSEDNMYSDSTGPGMAYQKKYAAYVVNRWGSYRNLLTWEYNNEYGVRSSLPWLHMMDSVIKAHENYNRSHTVSFWNFSWSQSSPVNASPYVTVTMERYVQVKEIY